MLFKTCALHVKNHVSFQFIRDIKCITWIYVLFNVRFRLEHWSRLYVRGWNPINRHCFLFSNILYCSDPGCSAIQFTHSSKQQHGCNQRDMDPPDILTVDRPSVHTVTDYLEVSGTFRPQGNCRTWGLWLTEGERNKGILKKVKWIHVKKKTSPVPHEVQYKLDCPTTVSCTALCFLI